MHVLNSKLQPPQCLNILDRKRLVNILKNKLQKNRIILITAGAGFGKTTLVASALVESKTQTIWYSLDSFDMDLILFLTCLIHSIRKKYSDFGNDNLNIPSMFSSVEKRNDFLIDFIKEIEDKLNHNTVIVLDDYYLIQKADAINEALEFILTRLPKSVHFVIISRITPPIKISKFKVRQQIFELDEKKLAFTLQEIQALYSKIYKIEISTENIKKIYKKTGGWAASLILLSYAFKNRNDQEIKDALLLLKGSEQDIFNYLEENVFDNLQQDIQDFMLKTSLFSLINPGIINQVLNINNAHELLLLLVEQHLLVFPFDDNRSEFYYHHLLRDFLRARLIQTKSSKDINRLHSDIAAVFENRDIVKALYHYIKGNAFDKIEELLKKHEIKYLLEGNIPYLRNCFDKIPHNIIEKMPQMLFMKAKLDSLYGKPQKAIDNLKIAHRIFKKRNSEEDILKCLVDLGTLYYNSSGDVQEAKQLMEQVVNEINENTSAFIIIMTYLIFFSAVLGEIDEAEKYTRKAKSVILDYPELERKISTILINTSNNYRYYITGDFYHSQKLNEQLLKSVLKLELQICLPLTYYQYSATSSFLGLYEKGCNYAEKGLHACGEIHLQDSQKGWLYNALAHNCLGLGNIEGAYENALQSFEIFESHSNRWGMANTYDLFHHISMARNQIHEAKQHLNAAFDIIDGYHLPVTQGILEISMANLLIAETNYKEAQEFLKQSRRKVNDAKYYLFKNYILETRCHLSFHNSEMACEWLEKSLEIAQTKSFDTYIIKENEWIIPLLVELYSKGKQISYIQKIINKTADKSTRILSQIKGSKNFQIALAASALLDNVPKPSVSVLNIHLLGRFKVLKGNKEVPIKKWKSSKALMIFKYLAAKRRAGFIPRDVLIELLWPDQDIKKTGKRFNVAMSALRKVLEPDIIPKAASSYILRKKDSYRLDPGKNINIDMDNFLDKINDLKNNSDKKNRELIDQCLSAESLYQGTFLEENILDEWCVSDREYLNEKFLHLLFEIIKIYENENNYIKCIQYAEKYLTADPYEESVYRKLMLSNAALGNNTNVLRTYKKCKENIEKLDCPIDKRTVVLLEKLIPQKK